MQLKRTTPTTCVIEPEGAMRVPGKIYVSEQLEGGVDEAAMQQVMNVASLPGIVGESIAMPDIHIGYGFPIGGVAAFPVANGLLSPGGIGFDINCGVRMLVTNLNEQQVKPLIEELTQMLGKAVPTGTTPGPIRLDHDQLDAVLTQGAQWAQQNGYATADDIERTEERGKLAEADPNAVSHRAKDRGVNQLGSLGSGNHFLEIQVVETILDTEKATVFGVTHPGQIVIMIHCGSRGVGHQVCSDYLRQMEDEYPQIAAGLPEKNLMYAPADSILGKRYFHAMAAAANFAWCNRQVIAHNVRKVFERLFPGADVKQLYDVSHNIAKKEMYFVHGKEQELYVHRKGATRAFGPNDDRVPSVYQQTGQPVLIPGSMGTASYVLAGTRKAMEESFGSCCHGAGRMMSRTKATETITGQQVRRELAERGIHVQGSARGLAEEAPQAYKDIDEVIRVVAEAGIAVPVAKLRPIGVLKG